jgi:hypothetical protein
MGSVPLLIYAIILGYPAKTATLIYQILTQDRKNSGKLVAPLLITLTVQPNPPLDISLLALPPEVWPKAPNQSPGPYLSNNDAAP